MKLTEEQSTILKHLREGLTNIEIAEELDYSPNTIKKKLKLMYKLFNVRGRTELVAQFMRKKDLYENYGNI